MLVKMKKIIRKKYRNIREALQQFLKQGKKQQQQLALQPIKTRKNIF